MPEAAQGLYNMLGIKPGATAYNMSPFTHYIPTMPKGRELVKKNKSRILSGLGLLLLDTSKMKDRLH